RQAGGQPTHPVLHPRLPEGVLDLTAPLAEGLPALVVERDAGAQLALLGAADRLGRIHSVAGGAGDREADAAEVDDRGADVEALGDLGDPREPDRVAGDPDGAVALPLPLEDEADDLADDRPAERRAVAAGRGGDPH